MKRLIIVVLLAICAFAAVAVADGPDPPPDCIPFVNCPGR